jgi:hypothetical protein
MAAYGIPEVDIARVLGVSKPTLRKHCGTEFDTGATRANSKVADFLFYGICGGTSKPAFKDERARVTAAIFWMKTRGGWSETSTQTHTVRRRVILFRAPLRLPFPTAGGRVPFGAAISKPSLVWWRAPVNAPHGCRRLSLVVHRC